MTFTRATRKALRTGRYMRDMNSAFAEYVLYKPTRCSHSGYVVYGFHQQPRPQWQPSAEDVLSRDWEVVDMPKGWTDVPPAPKKETGTAEKAPARKRPATSAAKGTAKPRAAKTTVKNDSDESNNKKGGTT